MKSTNETNSKKWLPSPETPDNLCTLPEIWSRHCDDIAVFRGFRSPTISDYTHTLDMISDALSKHPACEMSAIDIFDAITSVRVYPVAGTTRYYEDSIYAKRLAIIRDIYKYMESCGICANPLWYAPWELIGDGKLNPWLTSDDLVHKLEDAANALAAKRILPRYLPDDMERKLMQRIADNILEDGRWAGILILLCQGLRVSEARGLRYRDLVTLKSRPDRRKINIYGSADKQGLKKLRTKNKQSVRAVPEHIEVMTLLRKREAYIKATLGVDDIGDLPIICCDDDYTTPCPDTKFAAFIRTALNSLFGAKSDIKKALLIDLYLHPDPIDRKSKQVDPADYELSGRLLRRNYATQCYAKTDISDDDLALTMGHKTDDGNTYPYSESNILRMMDKLDHRMILPDLHPGWHFILQPQDHIDITDCGTVFLTLSPELLRQGGTIEIIAQTIMPGDAIILESNRRLPSGTVINIDTDYIPAPNIMRRPNTDTIHQPLPKWPEKK